MKELCRVKKEKKIISFSKLDEHQQIFQVSIIKTEKSHDQSQIESVCFPKSLIFEVSPIDAKIYKGPNAFIDAATEFLNLVNNSNQTGFNEN